ncbi:Uncharacterised protein [uncultured Avibacterium sp.]|uniref:TrbL/VirB6 plasmid conjugal transfer protein n=1 Tax=uncultured Avibacterium sp. TaxID=1936169 RepID=A0A486XB61_9PAST|nr:Uncharacterised protein [uncultured Avibacterium sp.]
MFGIFDKIEEFFKELLLGGIQANLESMFLDINDKVGAVATDVGKTPMGWNGDVFAFIKSINDSAIIPISVVIMLVVYGRMFEIYVYSSVSAIPFATMGNKEWGQIGTNYIKGLFALGLQGLFLMVCLGIYAVLVKTIEITDKQMYLLLKKQKRSNSPSLYIRKIRPLWLPKF